MRKSSGIKRGIATAAISALAVTGLPFLMSSASANPLSDQAGGANQVILVTPLGGGTAKNDGANTTVHLLAIGGADVQQVRFDVKPQGGPATPIATVNRANGAFSTEWTVPADLLNDPGTEIHAVGLSSVGTPLDTEIHSGTFNATGDSVDVANAPGSSVGVFEQPYAGPNNKALGIIAGTTSDVTGAADIAVADLDGPLGPIDISNDVANGATTRGWSGVVDLTGYSFAGAPDEAIVRALSAGGDDAEAVTVYQQNISTVDAVASPASVQTGGTSTGVVTVKDQNGNPIAGVQVFQDDDTNGVGDGAAVFTNSKGEARFPGLSSAATPGVTHTFFANVNGDVNYQNGVDFQRSVNVTSYNAVATTLTANSKDGAAFDVDENAAGDITISVEDQNNNPLTGQTVFYSWNVAPFATTAGYPKDLPQGTAVDNGDGTYNVAFPAGEPAGTYTLNYYINTDGTPGQGTTDPTGADLVVKSGQASLVWEDGDTAQAPAGTTATFSGSLELADGTALAGRTVSINWAKDGLGNAVLAAQAAQPAGTTRLSDTAATAVTQADGSFGVAVSDPAAPSQDELNGDLDADTTITPAAPTLDVDFLKNADPATAADIDIQVQNLIDGKATPGRPVDLDINVQNVDNVDLTDYPVTVKVDHGFLSPNAEAAADLVADPAAAQDGLYGEWKSDGVEKQYTTDDGGDTGAAVAIEKDAAFATSSTLTTTVTVTAGNVTTTKTIVFSTADPLNGSKARVELAAAADQTVGVLPKAPTTETVKYDLFVEDQFGNLVDNESVDLTDNLAGAKVNGVDGATTAPSQLENEAPSLTLSSTVAGAQTVSADWVVDSNTWTDGNAAPGFQPARDSDNEDTTIEGAGAPVDWYAIDYAASDYAMTDDGVDRNPVGDTVVVTYKAVDQNGEPIQGLQVNFFRAGPDAEQDGAGDAAVVTDANGEAQYVFQGITAGTAIIEAVVREPLPSTTIIPAAGVNHVVQFGNPKPNPNARIVKGASEGNKDVLTVKANALARGAKVIMYGKIGGEIVKVGQGRLNNSGRLVLKVTDRNGKKATQYAAIVRSTSRTTQDSTNVKRVR